MAVVYAGGQRRATKARIAPITSAVVLFPFLIGGISSSDDAFGKAILRRCSPLPAPDWPVALLTSDEPFVRKANCRYATFGV